MDDQIKAFIAENDHLLKTKEIDLLTAW